MPFILCRHPALAGTEPLAAHTKLELGRVVGSKVAKSDGGAMRVQANVIPAFKPVSG